MKEADLKGKVGNGAVLVEDKSNVEGGFLYAVREIAFNERLLPSPVIRGRVTPTTCTIVMCSLRGTRTVVTESFTENKNALLITTNVPMVFLRFKPLPKVKLAALWIVEQRFAVAGAEHASVVKQVGAIDHS